MTVSVAELPGLLPNSRPYHYATCSKCDASRSFAWPYSAEAWKAKHERECRGGLA